MPAVVPATIALALATSLALAGGRQDDGAGRVADGSRVESHAEVPPRLEELVRGLKVDAAKLAGDDARVGDREAFKVLVAVSSGGDAERESHLRFLRSVLDASILVTLRVAHEPPRAADPQLFVAARRLVESIAVGTRDEGPPFPGVEELVLPLLGHGTPEFREAVMRAVQALLDAGAEPGAEPAREALLERLGGLVESGLGAEALLEGDARATGGTSGSAIVDACRLLWEADGKRFLRHTIAGMTAHRDTRPATTALYLQELRARLAFDPGSPEAWETWWKESRERSLADILVGIQRRLALDAADSWRRSLKRFREAGDPDQVLAEIGSVLQTSTAREMRLAAVGALGDLAEWLRGTALPTGASAETARVELQTRACTALVDVVDGKSLPHEAPAVRRAALVALRRFQPFLEKGAPELVERVARQVEARLAVVATEGGEPVDALDWSERRAELLEAILTAGALKLSSLQVHLETILANPAFARDGEVLVATTQSLGRLVKAGLGDHVTDLLLACFERARELPEADAAKLRSRCVSALNARPEGPEVGAKIRDFYGRLLANPTAGELRVHAIVGLGTLAQAKDEAAFDLLASVLDTPQRFDASELIAAVDAVAYVGGRPALVRFLPFLRVRAAQSGTEKTVADHVRRKVDGLLRAEGLAGLEWLLVSVESRAYREDDPSYLAWIVAIFEEPAYRAHLVLEAKDVNAANGELAARLRITARYLCARLATEVDDTAEKLVLTVASALAGFPQLADSAKPELAAFERLTILATAAGKVRETLDAGGEAKGFLEAVERLLEASGSLRGATPEEAVGLWAALRRVERLLGDPARREKVQLRPVYEGWVTYLRTESTATLWKELPETFREAYLRRLEAVRPEATSTGSESSAPSEE